MKTFPTLFKKSETGAIVQWDIRVEADVGGHAIVVTWGQEGGALQVARDVIREGKNLGKKNSTTSFEQACLEAESKWEKQLKNKKYAKTREAAMAGEREAEFVTGGVDPMLAFPIEKKPKALKYPCDVQPKLDGHRCIAIVSNGKATLWSRTRKPITGVPHIAIHIERAFAGKGDVVLDGELYNHTMKAEFEKIVSYVRQVKPAAGHEIVQYHIYDTIRPGSFEQRNQALLSTLPQNSNTLIFVQTEKVDNEEGMMEWFSDFRADGYEGCMVRNAKGVYKNARSYDLQKVKEMDDDEFEIIGTEEGRGKMAGKAIFVCKTKSGETFTAKMEGAIDALAKYLNNKKVVGKMLTVRYQGFTNGNVPRFPVGVIVRDYE